MAVMFKLQPLPPKKDIETKAVLRQAAVAHRKLAELKGISVNIPNQGILINSLSLQEAKDSSAVENIITTHDELFKKATFPKYAGNAAAKEVQNYATALRTGYTLVAKDGILSGRHIQDIQEQLEANQAGYRRQAGTNLKNEATGEVVYTPPQSHKEILDLMDNLEKFINEDDLYDADLLVKMALVHYQFESIHPFYNGNGRTGRIINVLYLVLKNLLDIPVLYLSRHIIETKAEYYQRLQDVRDHDAWEAWVLYMLAGVEKTSQHTIQLVQGIRDAMQFYKVEIRKGYKFYSQDLINNLFSHPYTKIGYVMRDLKVTRLTAAKYLDELAEAKFLSKQKIGRSNYYINNALYGLLTEPPNLQGATESPPAAEPVTQEGRIEE
ncbi:MAG: Fic family protein [Deltaproteobacteria bacterium]|nr:Fic family protein [Deltaproteobacteria bacterium]